MSEASDKSKARAKKEALIQRIWDEMKIKTHQMHLRHAEVQKDKSMAESQNCAVTAEQSTITTRDHRIKRDLKLDPKESTLHPKESTLDPIESTPDTIQCRKVEREWDKGKSTLGSNWMNNRMQEPHWRGKKKTKKDRKGSSKRLKTQTIWDGPYNLKDFDLLKVIGRGAYGKVLLAKLNENGMHVAIKSVKKHYVLERRSSKRLMQEKEILSLATQHPYISKLYCTFQTEKHLFFVMEHLNRGDLAYNFRRYSPFDDNTVRFYGAEIICALKFLHENRVIHRDIKLENVMIDSEGHANLGDFGLSHPKFDEKETNSFLGTHGYMAPEIIKGEVYNQSVDWWSFGILLYILFVGRLPFDDQNQRNLFNAVLNDEPNYPQSLTPNAKILLEKFLIKTADKRLGMPSSSAGKVEDQAFFIGIDWEKLEKKQIPPPFKPSVWSAFRTEEPTLSLLDFPISPDEQQQFQGF